MAVVALVSPGTRAVPAPKPDRVLWSKTKLPVSVGPLVIARLAPWTFTRRKGPAGNGAEPSPRSNGTGAVFSSKEEVPPLNVSPGRLNVGVRPVTRAATPSRLTSTIAVAALTVTKSVVPLRSLSPKFWTVMRTTRPAVVVTSSTVKRLALTCWPAIARVTPVASILRLLAARVTEPPEIVRAVEVEFSWTMKAPENVTSGMSTATEPVN